MDCNDVALFRALRSVEAAALGMPSRADLQEELAIVQRAQERGWFTPDEDEQIRTRYGQYLSARMALLATLQQIEGMLLGLKRGWADHLPYFATAFAAASLMVRGSSFIVELARARPVVWKKLDEPEQRFGLPRYTFTALHKATTDRKRRRQFREAMAFYQEHREEIHALEQNETFSALVKILRQEETYWSQLPRGIWRDRMWYRWFSFLRKHHAGYRRVMFHLFRWSGSAIAELRQPGIKPPGAPKRITEQQRATLLEIAQPGDVFITRHDDAMSNLFLPGFWPHAALFLGKRAVLENVAGALPPSVRARYHDSIHFLEAKKDGVRLRSAEETLRLDACLVFRPPLAGEALAEALIRALSHEGKLYDFLFDFRTADRLACTEVVYRVYYNYPPVHFHLIQTGGRACIPAEELIDQMLACGFSLVASCNIEDGVIRRDAEAMNDLIASRGQNNRA
jgi:hypothetical protein